MNQLTKKRIHISDIPLSWLNSRCLDLIAKYANAAYVQEGKFISPISSSIILEITEHANSTNSPSLTNLFHKFKIELKNSLADRSLLEKVNAIATDIDYKLAPVDTVSNAAMYQPRQSRLTPEPVI